MSDFNRINVQDIINGGQKEKVDISMIRVPEYHDRTDVDDENIESLANNMSEVGQLSPILLDKKSDEEFDLISGLRRLDAALKLNWSEIDAIIFENLDEQSRSLVMITENAQRVDLNVYDLVNSLIHYAAVSTGKTDEELVNFLYKLRNLDAGNVKNISFEEKKWKKNIEEALARTDKYTLKNVISKLKVINFHPAIIKAMKDKKLLFSYAFQLNKIKDEEVMKALLNRFVTKQITKDELRKEIKKYTGGGNVGDIVPFSGTLKKLKDFKTLPEEKQNFVVTKMQEIDTVFAV
jgi:ParB family chromosome partitioning protein